MELPVINHEDYFAKIGDDHKFPINKFGELANYLLEKKIINHFHKPYPCSVKTLKGAHSQTYIKNIINKSLDQNGVKKIGFPLVDSVVKRSLVATGGTVLASKLALEHRIACNTAGGSHHANFDEGAGYCVFNDVAVAAQYLLKRSLVKKIIIVSLPFLWNNFLEPFQRQRILTFIDPSNDPYGSSWNITQSKIAIGSGGMSGKGYQEGSQANLNFLPEAETDFIFAVIAEEFGFVGICILLAFFFFILLRCLYLAFNVIKAIPVTKSKILLLSCWSGISLMSIATINSSFIAIPKL